MSGNIFEELKKNDLNKKRDQLKFTMTILSTNLLVAIASYSLFTDNPGHVAVNDLKRTLHPHHQMIIAPLTLLVDNNKTASEMPVTLMDRNKKILVQKAYLYEEIKRSNETSGPPRFKIEIPEEDMLKLSADDGTPMIAMPELKMELPKKASKKRVSKYEINL